MQEYEFEIYQSDIRPRTTGMFEGEPVFIGSAIGYNINTVGREIRRIIRDDIEDIMYDRSNTEVRLSPTRKSKRDDSVYFIQAKLIRKDTKYVKIKITYAIRKVQYL